MLRALLVLAATYASAVTNQCADGSYCCPDAKACLTATTTTCREDGAKCGDGQVCCPLTKLCVNVGDKCTPPCEGAYCCPGSNMCVAPQRPGVLCSHNETAGMSPCWSDEHCCPLTNLCIKKTGAKCAA